MWTTMDFAFAPPYGRGTGAGGAVMSAGGCITKLTSTGPQMWKSAVLTNSSINLWSAS